MKRIAAVVAFTAGLALLLVQLVPSSRPANDAGPAVAAEVGATPEVAALLRRACADCHSHSTRWPWYSHVAPVSWLVESHVRDGRRFLNFSRWPADPKSAAYHLEEVAREISTGRMPLPSYLALHSAARLSNEEVRTLCVWAENERLRLTEAERPQPINPAKAAPTRAPRRAG